MAGELALERRWVYLTRHTTAAFHVAAGKRPPFCLPLLGHSSIRMLFERMMDGVAVGREDFGIPTRPAAGSGKVCDFGDLVTLKWIRRKRFSAESPNRRQPKGSRLPCA